MSLNKTIQIISDISDQSWNEMYAVMRGVAANITNDQVEIAPITPVSELSITHGAFLTRLMAKSYFSPVVMFTNVAPHQTFKSDLICKLKGTNTILMGSNNGIFDWISRDFDLDYLAEITVKRPFVVNGKLMYKPGSKPPDDYDDQIKKESAHKTFGAHVIYGAIAVGLATGADYRMFGEDRTKDFIVPLEIKEGEIVHVDNYGNAKIYGVLDFEPDSNILISAGNKQIAQAKYITGRMMSAPTGEYVVYPSTSLPHMVDLALVRGNAAQTLNLKIGDKLSYKAL